MTDFFKNGPEQTSNAASQHVSGGAALPLSSLLHLTISVRTCLIASSTSLTDRSQPISVHRGSNRKLERLSVPVRFVPGHARPTPLTRPYPQQSSTISSLLLLQRARPPARHRRTVTISHLSAWFNRGGGPIPRTVTSLAADGFSKLSSNRHLLNKFTENRPKKKIYERSLLS